MGRAAGGGADTHVTERVKDLVARYGRTDGCVQVQVSGLGAIFEQVGTTIEGDLQSAESIAFPVTAVALIVVFGSAIAAGLPLAIGALSIIATFAVPHLIALLTDVALLSINLATAMGLALPIDYTLFRVTRRRAQRQKWRRSA